MEMVFSQRAAASWPCDELQEPTAMVLNGEECIKFTITTHHSFVLTRVKKVLLKLKPLSLSDQDHPGQSLLRSGSSTEADGLFNTTSLQDPDQYLPPQWPCKTGTETPPALRNHHPFPDWNPEQHPDPKEVLLQTQTSSGPERGGQKDHRVLSGGQ